MPKHQLTLKPHIPNAILPLYAKKLAIYALAATTVYAMQAFIQTPLDNNKFLGALIATALIIPLLETKPRIIQLHNTKYHFYDTYVQQEKGILNKKKDGIPYKQISKIVNTTSLWDRLTNASDITLKSARHGEGHDLTLKSIQNADEIEQKIYKLLKHGTDKK